MLGEETQAVSELLTEHQAYQEVLKGRLAEAKNHMKLYADKHYFDRQFQEGEYVLLKLQLYVQNSVVSGACTKLAYKFYGPFKVLQRIGSVAYNLDLLAQALVHLVFHVSQLKPFVPNSTPIFSDISVSTFV